MKIRYSLIYFQWILIAFLVISCKKDDSPPDTNGTTLDKIVYYDYSTGGVTTLQYKYNSDGYLSSLGSPIPMAYGRDSLAYSASGKLSEFIAATAVFIMIYDSIGRIIKKIVSPDSSNSVTDYFAIGYDDKGRIIADSNIYQSKVYSYQTYSYDNNDNITGYQKFVRSPADTFQAGDKTVIAYDHKINPYSKIGKILYYCLDDYTLLFKENVVSEKVGGVDHLSPANPKYEYYSNGWLQKTSVASPNSATIYYYKKP